MSRYNRILTQHLEMGYLCPHMKTFSEALIEATKDGNPSLRALCSSVGVSYGQMKKVRQGGTQRTNVEDARKIAAYFGKTLEQFIDDPSMSVHIELADTLNKLEPQEASILLQAAKAQIAARNQSPEESD